MRFGRRIPLDRTRARSCSTGRRTNRLLVETLERRGMLSATIGSLADQVVDDASPAEEYAAPVDASPDAGVGVLGLPEGVCLAIGSPVDSATRPFLVVCNRPIVDAVIAEPVPIEPLAIEPIDVRSTFVSADFSWAAYSCSVGADGEVQGVSATASYEDSTIATFVAHHGSDPGVEVHDDGCSWSITGFPPELAPPVPAGSESWGWSEYDGVVDAAVPDAPPMDEGGQYWPEYQYDERAHATSSVDGSADESGWDANPVSSASLDGTAVQRGFTPQESGPGAPRPVAGASRSRPTGDLSAAAMWMNLSGGETVSVHPAGGKRRSR